MSASIVKKGKKWYIIIDMKDENGKRKRKWISGFDTRKAAQKRLPEILQEVNNRTFVDTKDITLEEYLKQWLDDYAISNIASSTYKKYLYAIKKISSFPISKMKLQQIRPMHIQNFMQQFNNLDISHGTIASYYRVFKTAINHAVKLQMIPNNPFDVIKAPRGKKTAIKVLNMEEIQWLLDETKDTNIYPIIVLAVFCGLRRGEILGLQWEDIDFSTNTLNIKNNLGRDRENNIVLRETKTAASKRAVGIGQNIVEVLKQVKKKKLENKLFYGKQFYDNNFVCTWENGKPFSPEYISNKFQKILKKLNLPPVRFHDLRHAHATLLLQQGVHPKVVQERLGHTSISITLDTYSHLIPSMQKNAAEDLERIFF